MIKSYVGNIIGLNEVDYICNAANAQGIMGAGVAGAIRNAGGIGIQVEAINICKNKKYKAGDIYATNAGNLSYKKILHLVTMTYPGGFTSLQIVKNLLCKLVEVCKIKGITKIALPALGTGIGRLDKKEVAKLYKSILGPIKDIEFHIVDLDLEFIKYME